MLLDINVLGLPVVNDPLKVSLFLMQLMSILILTLSLYLMELVKLKFIIGVEIVVLLFELVVAFDLLVAFS